MDYSKLSKTQLIEIAEKAAKAASAPLTCKVSQKGCVSVYGLQRRPVTLYASQWERLAPFMPNITDFISANNDKLARKE
jgi:hypothetical protein